MPDNPRSSPRPARRLPATLLWPGLLLIFAAVALLALGCGAPVPFADIWSGDSGKAEIARGIFFGLRPARIVAGILIGASLAVSGAALQATFRNPLADPYLLGISAGGALGAAIGLAVGHSYSLPALPGPLAALDLGWLLAFGGALAATAAVYVLGRRGGGARGFENSLDRGHLLLCGVALSAFLAALMSLVVALSNRNDIAQQVMFWMLGGLADVRPAQNAILAVCLVIGMAAMLGSARDLNALRLGDEEARSLGVDVSRVQRRLLVAAALMSAASVAAAGLIGFVGLLAPHLIRVLFGDDARRLVPAAAIGGATLLVGCDAIARSAARPVELPVGIVTALSGVPLFLYLASKVEHSERRPFRAPTDDR